MSHPTSPVPATRVGCETVQEHGPRTHTPLGYHPQFLLPAPSCSQEATDGEEEEEACSCSARNQEPGRGASVPQSGSV